MTAGFESASPFPSRTRHAPARTPHERRPDEDDGPFVDDEEDDDLDDPEYPEE